MFLKLNLPTTKNKKRMVFGILLFVVLLVAAILSSGSVPEYSDSVPPTYVVKEEESTKNSWKGIAPGSTPLAEERINFGKQMTADTRPDGTVVYTYSYVNEYFPITVGVSPEGTIDYVRVSSVVNSLSDYSTEKNRHDLAEPSMDMYLSNDYMIKVSVFLEKGIAFEYNEFSGEVLNVRYFTPTTSSDFLSKWGTDLTKEYVHTQN